MGITTLTIAELEWHPYSAYQRPCMVTMATRWKVYNNFESMWQGLQYDI